MSDAALLFQQLLNGLSLASIYALVAVGITLIFGLTGVVNFAHGELLMVGAYLALVMAPTGLGGMLFVVVAVAAGVALLSMILERGFFRFTIGRPINGFIVSLGLILIIQNTVIGIFSINPRRLTPVMPGSLALGPVRLGYQRITIILITLALIVLLYLLIKRTRFGLGLQASAMDPETAELMGVSVRRTVLQTFALGGALAGVGGALVANLFPLTPLIGAQYVVLGFAVALVGGLGSVSGALAAAVIVGLAEAMIVTYGPAQWVGVFVFGAMVLVLLLRPEGLFRGTEGSSVL